MPPIVTATRAHWLVDLHELRGEVRILQVVLDRSHGWSRYHSVVEEFQDGREIGGQGVFEREALAGGRLIERQLRGV